MPASRISPERAFTSSLSVAQRAQSHGKATITKTEAQKALKALDGAAPADQARIVRDFLDSKGAGALSPKAKEALADFVKKAGGGGDTGGANAVTVKAAARDEAQQATKNLQKAQERIDQLLSGAPTKRPLGGLQQVKAWLDAAEADVLQAKDQLKRLAANPAAKAAAKELTTAQKEIGKAADDVQKLIDKAKGAGVKKADLENVRAWLAAPMPELASADSKLGPERQTRKFPSDNEDGGGGGGGGMMVTMKAPSDNEDGGAAPGPSGPGDGGGMVTTRKFPSDNEDGGASGPGTGGGAAVTLKYPSDNEDGGGAPLDNAAGYVKKEAVDEMRQIFMKANRSTTLSVDWQRGSVRVGGPVGVRYTEVELLRERHPDGYKYTALIPTPLNPNALQADPTKPRDFWVEREGGITGGKFFAGPFHIG